MMCDPEVLPYGTVTDKFITKCRCGHKVEWETREEAEADAQRHLEEKE